MEIIYNLTATSLGGTFLGSSSSYWFPNYIGLELTPFPCSSHRSLDVSKQKHRVAKAQRKLRITHETSENVKFTDQWGSASPLGAFILCWSSGGDRVERGAGSIDVSGKADITFELEFCCLSYHHGNKGECCLVS